MKIIAGLGNPGKGYKNTRHNAGFMVIKEISQKHGILLKKKAFGGLYGFGKIFGKEVILFEPQTYMNLSGEAVNAVCARHLEKREDLLVINDDTALTLGTIRIREKGSSGGHNGLKSIIQYIGTDFARLRVGVGKGGPLIDMKDHVLSDFLSEEGKVLDEVIRRAAMCAEKWISEGLKRAMEGYNDRKTSGEKLPEAL